MTTSIFSTRATSDEASANKVVPVTPDDASPLPQGLCRAVFVGDAGDLAIEDASGGVSTVASGAAQYHPIRARRILATGTTAGRVLALY